MTSLVAVLLVWLGALSMTAGAAAQYAPAQATPTPPQPTSATPAVQPTATTAKSQAEADDDDDDDENADDEDQQATEDASTDGEQNTNTTELNKEADEANQDEQEEAAEKKKKEAEEKKKKQERLQKIKKLNFDRRPSAILAAWRDVAAEQLEKEKQARQAQQNTDDQKQPESGQSETSHSPAGAETSAESGEHSGDQPSEQPADAKQDQPGFDEQIKDFQRNVTLGRWPQVKQFLAELPEDEGKAMYQRLLQSLRGTPPNIGANVPQKVRAQLMQIQQVQQQQRRGQPETNSFSYDDVTALVDCAPTELNDDAISSLGGIVRLIVAAGNLIDNFVEQLEAEVSKSEDKALLNRRQAAKMLFAANKPLQAGDFLPSVEDAEAQDDFEALNLLARYFEALHRQEKTIEHLESAWKVTQAVLGGMETEKKQSEQALKRAVELAPRVRDELGQAWLEESFVGRPQRGIEIIAAIGGGAANALQTQAHNPAQRLKNLQLQTTAVEALLSASSDRARQWQDKLSLLAGNWLREAIVAYQYDQSTSRGPSLRRDSFGNFYYHDQNNDPRRNVDRGNKIRAVNTADLLDIQPSQAWLDLIEESLKPKFDMVFAQLYLKVNEEDQAFPYIERLAAAHPDVAEDLVDEFLRVWTNNHDPNAQRNRTNYYIYMYGYERKAESIPLTRSKQERNLRELAKLVGRLRALPLNELDEKLLAKAFTTCHSSAEVYRPDAIENVFGPLADLDPETLAELAQKMRSNLAGLWRAPAVQKDNGTRRQQKDIQREVLRGYDVARSVIEQGLANHPDQWSLHLAKAALEHDENNYRKDISPDSQFSERRDDAFAGFRRAAELYAQTAEQLREDEETTRPYELWYYASLGACDLGQITEERVPDLRQPAKIRDAILALPGEARQRHLAMFANSLFTRMSAVKPAVKYRYVRSGLDIVGAHKQAAEARKVFDYYKDLITEIKLETVVDGPDVVEHDRPFGVFVNLRHTREIERESGGFGRYLQNQNSGNAYSYNYGRPLENYRDKFEEIVGQALGEHFEILSVTFQSEDVHSRALPEYGWRVTPYAYLLLKSKGPQVDKIPPVRLDLDFLDTSGYAIIPIESPALPIDCTTRSTAPRPFRKLAVTQTLDERQADEGKLILEVKVASQGLVPDLLELVDLAPEGFEIVATDDQGLAVSRFDPESEESVVVSERTWMVTMQAQPDHEGRRPTSFRFAAPKVDVHEVTYQRYNDADLLTVGEEISLEQQYGATNLAWLRTAGAVAAVVLLILAAVLYYRPSPEADQPQARFARPSEITPFTVLGLLRNIERNNGLNETRCQELRSSIAHLEQHYFADQGGKSPNLEAIADLWSRRASEASSSGHGPS